MKRRSLGAVLITALFGGMGANADARGRHGSHSSGSRRVTYRGGAGGGGGGGGSGGCGSRGGPGYRKPNGKCASHRD